MENIYDYVEDIVLSIGGNGNDVEAAMREIEKNNYTTIEEVRSYMDREYYKE